MHSQVTQYLNENKLLSPFQFGFQRKMSTELAATQLLDDIRKHVDQEKLVGAVFLDLSKAFDSVSHSKLLYKLSKYGIKDTELDWFADYLFGQTMQVSYTSLSEPRFVKVGVPQGSVIGPLLFLIFYNDITDVIHSASIIKYADDTVIYVAGKNVKDINLRLSNTMNSLAYWLHENELVLNLKKGKTEGLLFGTAQRLRKVKERFNVIYRGNLIEVTTRYRYLGIEIDASLNLNSQFERNFKRASRRLRLLSKLQYCLDGYSTNLLYNSMILPTFTNCGILSLKLTSTQQERLSGCCARVQQLMPHASITAPDQGPVVSKAFNLNGV